MKTTFALLALAAVAPSVAVQGVDGLFSLQALERLGGWGVLAGVLVYQTKQQGRAVAALEESVAQQGETVTALKKSVDQQAQILDALNRHDRSDVIAFARLENAIERAHEEQRNR